MQINRSIRYALRVVIEIGKANGPILQKQIADSNQLSIKYLDYIIRILKAKGLIKNHKGRGSGYILAKPLHEISVFDIYTAFDSLAVVNCIEDEGSCSMVGFCKARCFWTGFKSHTENYLKSQTLDKILSN